MDVQIITQTTEQSCAKEILLRKRKKDETDDKDDLPKLPVPPLEQTLCKFLLYAQPLLTDEQYERAEKLVDDFEETGGAKLQFLLEQRAALKENWLCEWWTNYAYLDGREEAFPVPLVYPKQNFQDENDQLRFAAKVIHGVAEHKIALDNGELSAPVVAGRRIDMSSLRHLYCSCRVPREKRDVFVSYPEQGEDAPKHIIVIRNNHFFSMDVYDNEGNIFAERELYNLLAYIVSVAEDRAPPVGLLTSLHRDTWASIYQDLETDPTNRYSLKMLESSIVVVSLDQQVPGLESLEDASRAIQQLRFGGGSHHNAANRWLDKPYQVVICPDGNWGNIMEHSKIDGLDVATLFNSLMAKIKTPFETVNGHKTSRPTPRDAVHKLTIHPSNDVQNMMTKAAWNFDRFSANDDTEYVDFKDIGSKLIKTLGQSPDGFFQVALQLAYYRMHGRITATYESCATKHFRGARTDTIHSCTIASKDYCKSMTSDKSSPSDRACRLRQAIASHRANSQETARGNGIDRHFLGLRMISNENDLPLPKLLTDPIFSIVCQQYAMSTSQLWAKDFLIIACSPLIADGYSVIYNIQNNGILATISTNKDVQVTDARSLKRHLHQALLDGRDLLECN